MDLEVLHEQTDSRPGDDGSAGYAYGLTLQPGEHAAAVVTIWSPEAQVRIRETFQAIWSGRAEADQFNTLVLSAGLNWQQVAILRSYSRYFRQISLPYSQARVQRILLDDPESTQAIIALFAARFGDVGHGADHPERLARMATAAAALDARIDAAVHIDADRVLRAYRSLITATVRTNAYAPEALTALAPYLVHKIRAREVDEIPEPRPLSEIIVYSPDFEGLHLRHALVARGGLRWSDRVDDYRTEVLGLVKAQAVKNAVIVPSGAKGVFVIKRHPGAVGESVDARTRQTNGRRCYRQFISALLDVVDLTPPGVADVPRAGVVCHDGADHYMVVAADKGTATFSDTANAIALQRGFWLGDAFASGGSTGFDHKAMGITARGAWVSGDAHLRELGIDTSVDEFTAVGIGDMSGDVFGNGMLLRPNVRLIAAFDHRHVFIDPCPQVQRAFEERQRLFVLPQSSWADYDPGIISTGGGVWPRTAKSITITAQIREALGLDDSVTTVTPHELIGHILRAPVDLLWNGGVGTYVKASDESHADVGDKANDLLRVDASEIRSRTIVEGGNLGVSPRGRIEFCDHGGLINTDAIDNAAGVDCSDHEVNIKIVVDSLVKAQRIPASGRADLLASLTDPVADLVLANNRDHTRILSDARFNASKFVAVHERMTDALERRRGVNRKLENLPTRADFARLRKAGGQLTTPQLATLLAHVKLDLKADLLSSEQLDASHFTAKLDDYFPAALRERAGGPIVDHPLGREIIATSTINHIMATSGLTYAFRIADETGATTADIACAHAVVSAVFGLDALWAQIYDAGVAPDLVNMLVIEGRRLLDRASRWFLLNRPQPLDVDAEIKRFAPIVATLTQRLPELLQGRERATVVAAREGFVDLGAPEAAARTISESLYAFSLLDIVEAASSSGEDPGLLAEVYFELSDHLGIDHLLLAVSRLPRGERWHSLARLALREDLYRAIRDLSVDVARRVAQHEDASAIEEFELFNRRRFERARRTLDDIAATGEPELAVLSVAASQLRNLSATHV
jgi:glutamate dehydrogenase